MASRSGLLSRQSVRDNLSFALLQWCFWSAFGLIFGFLVAYLEWAGYSNFQTGTVMALVALVGIVGQPVWGYAADRVGSTRLVMRIAMVGAAISSVGLLLYGDKAFIAVLLFSLLGAFTLQPLPPLIDSWTVRTNSARGGVNYGVTRAMGSIGFSVTVAVVGNLMDSWGMNVMFYGNLIMMGVTFLVMSLIWEVKVGNADARSAPAPTTDEDGEPVAAVAGRTTGTGDPDGTTGPGRQPNPIELVRNPDIVAFLVIAMLIFTAFRAAQIYLPMLVTARGGSNSHLGMALSVMAISEVPMLALSSLLLKRFEDVTVLLWSFIFFTLRIVLHLVVTSPWGVVVIQAAQGISFALFLPASVHFMHRVAPEGLKTTAQALAAASSFGVGSVVASFLGSVVIEYGSIFDVYRYGGILAAVTVVVYYLTIYRRRHRRRAAAA